jgi:hypothetical protein
MKLPTQLYSRLKGKKSPTLIITGGTFMNDVCVLDNDVDLCISMTWYPNKPHGVSGHVYEIIEYYLLLSKHYKMKILFGDTFDRWEQFKQVILDKYDLSEKQLHGIESATLFYDMPRYVKGRNIFFVDGGLIRLEKIGTKLMFDNIIVFKCSVAETIYDRQYKNIILLQDNRLYKKWTPEDVNISIDYKKKIYFKYFKNIPKTKSNTALIYGTTNCRFITPEDLDKITNKYEFDRYILITNNTESYINNDNITIITTPVDRLFELFDTYIYTPLQGVWDGSSRFPAECKFFNKDVIYHNIDKVYLERDTGLKYRKYDIENDFASINLQDDDSIIDILRSNI